MFTILNVEDVKHNRDLVRRILENEGYQVVDAVNGLEGIAKAIELEPDLILLDINLPDIDGFSVATKIRGHHHLAQTPIIAVTARTVANDRERAEAIGCDSYVRKPIDVDALIQEVERFIGQKLPLKEAESQREFFLREHSLSLVEKIERKFEELRSAHDDLTVMHKRLQRLDKAKTDFIGIASHELRTPLTTLRFCVDLLCNTTDLGENQRASDIMTRLTTGVDRLSSIIDDMISIVEVELSTLDLKYGSVSLEEVMAVVVAEVGAAIETRNLTLTVNIPPNLPTITGDAKQLCQVFSRLIGNAIKYTADHGKIDVWVGVHEAQAQSQNSGQPIAPDKFIEIAVCDTGIGINKEDQTEIFEKFYTAEDINYHSSGKTQFLAGGPGLGLTIVKGIVEAHAGRIWVESEGYDPEKQPGSTFYVLLPTQNMEAKVENKAQPIKRAA